MKEAIIFILFIGAGLWLLPKESPHPNSSTNLRRVPSSETNLEEKAVASVSVKSTSIKTKGSYEQAQLNTRIEMKITGKSMEQVAAQMMNIDVFNAVAEFARIVEKDEGQQKTVKTMLSSHSYSLLKKAWVVHNIFGTIDLGETKANCNFNLSTKLFTLECKKDPDHKMTNKRMLSLYSYLRCDDLSSGINCTQTLSLTPKKMTVWGKSISANEVAMIGALQSIRFNSAIAFSLVAKSPADAYYKFNNTEIESKLTDFKTNFNADVEDHEFKFP